MLRFVPENGSAYPMRIVAYPATEARLAGTCFRDPSIHCSGNFITYRNLEEVFSDATVISALANGIRRLPSSVKARNIVYGLSITVDFQDFVGWSSTARRDDFSRNDLEHYQPNRKSYVLRVKKGSGHLAPLARELTTVFDFSCLDETVLVQTIYPGEDIGPLRGDITAREGIVMFDWNHPGQPTP